MSILLEFEEPGRILITRGKFMKMMKTFLAIVTLLALATPVMADDSDHTESQAKLKSIKTSDISGYEAQMAKETGHPIKLDVDWKSFDKVSAEGAGYLGSTLHSIVGGTVNNKTSDFTGAMEKIKTIHVKNDSKAKAPSVTSKKSGEILVKANFNSITWPAEKGFEEQTIQATKNMK